MFALCPVQEEVVKTGFCHESVHAASLIVEEREVVVGKEVDEWQATMVGVETATATETAIFKVERYVTFSVFGVYI